MSRCVCYVLLIIGTVVTSKEHKINNDNSSSSCTNNNDTNYITNNVNIQKKKLPDIKQKSINLDEFAIDAENALDRFLDSDGFKSLTTESGDSPDSVDMNTGISVNSIKEQNDVRHIKGDLSVNEPANGNQSGAVRQHVRNKEIHDRASTRTHNHMTSYEDHVAHNPAKSKYDASSKMAHTYDDNISKQQHRSKRDVDHYRTREDEKIIDELVNFLRRKRITNNQKDDATTNVTGPNTIKERRRNDKRKTYDGLLGKKRQDNEFIDNIVDDRSVSDDNGESTNNDNDNVQIDDMYIKHQNNVTKLKRGSKRSNQAILFGKRNTKNNDKNVFDKMNGLSHNNANDDDAIMADGGDDKEVGEALINSVTENDSERSERKARSSHKHIHMNADRRHKGKKKKRKDLDKGDNLGEDESKGKHSGKRGHKGHNLRKHGRKGDNLSKRGHKGHTLRKHERKGENLRKHGHKGKYSLKHTRKHTTLDKLRHNTHHKHHKSRSHKHRTKLPKSDELPVSTKKGRMRSHKKLYEYKGRRKENVRLNVDGTVKVGNKFKKAMKNRKKGKGKFQPMGGKPVGPIAIHEAFQKEYRGRFTENAKETIPWEEPTLMTNCWAQSMLTPRHSFAPNCNRDGTFSSKQCYLERCWCVNRDGKPRVRNENKRFYYGMSGLMLKC